MVILSECGCTFSPKKVFLSHGNTTYYINPATGDDKNSGLKAAKVWRNFSHVNQLQLSPGDLRPLYNTVVC